MGNAVQRSFSSPGLARSAVFSERRAALRMDRSSNYRYRIAGRGLAVVFAVHFAAAQFDERACDNLAAAAARPAPPASMPPGIFSDGATLDHAGRVAQTQSREFCTNDHTRACYPRTGPLYLTEANLRSSPPASRGGSRYPAHECTLKQASDPSEPSSRCLRP